MNYTTEQLQAMSDFEVNKALFKKLGCRGSYQEGTDGGLVFENWSIIDYCNNPNDIMPLAFERGIGIEKSPLRIEWIARTCEVNMSNKQFRCCIDTNPLRAIACCLLMM